MFYKNEIISLADKKEIQEKYHAEFSFALYEHMKKTQDVRFSLMIKSEDGIKKPVYSCVALTEPSKKNSTYFDVFANNMIYKLPKNILIPYRNREYTMLESNRDLKLEDMTKLFKDFDIDKHNEYKSLISEFMLLKDEGEIQNKQGKTFNFKIFEDTSNLDGSLITDTIKLYDGEKQIGFLTTRYTTNSVASKIQGKDFSVLGKSLDDTAFQRLLNAYELQLDEYNRDYLKERTLRDLRTDFDKFKKENQEYLKNAIVHDVYIAPEYRRQNLATELYLKMADHAYKNNHDLKGASVRPDEIIALWDKMFRTNTYQVNIDEMEGHFTATLSSEKCKQVKFKRTYC